MVFDNRRRGLALRVLSHRIRPFQMTEKTKPIAVNNKASKLSLNGGFPGVFVFTNQVAYNVPEEVQRLIDYPCDRKYWWLSDDNRLDHPRYHLLHKY